MSREIANLTGWSTFRMMLVPVLAVLFLGNPSGLALAQKSGVAVIDVHTHLVPGPGMRFEQSLAAAAATMDRYGIATSILMSPPRKAGVKQNYDIADFRAALKKFPGRFVYLGGGGTLNPTLHTYGDPASVTEKVQAKFAAQARRLIDQGAKGYGEMGSLHISLSRKHGYSFVPADHPLMKSLADVAAERGVPIDLHMDALRSDMKPPPELAGLPNNPKIFPATLKGLESLLAHNPKAKIVWAHGGTDHLGDFSAAIVGGLMKKHANLYLSLKVSGPKAPTRNRLFLPGRLDPAWRSLFQRYPDRFVIGSDSFYADPQGRGPAMEFSRRAEPRLKATAIFLSLLPADLRRKIGRENAMRLYRLTSLEAPDKMPAGPAASASPAPKKVKRASGGLCKDGNMAHCRTACGRGVKAACARLRRGR